MRIGKYFLTHFCDASVAVALVSDEVPTSTVGNEPKRSFSAFQNMIGPLSFQVLLFLLSLA